MIGSTISHYKITEKLGEGGMGVVYKAEDTKLHRPVALKFLSAPTLADDERRKRFFQEARAAAALDHPNICVVHGIDEADGLPFIVMSYIDGETAEQRIASNSVSFGEAVHIAAGIAGGLQEAHSNGVLHRDIKPANVMLSREGRVKITDFGLAHLIGSARLTKSGMTVGTTPYMAPEQVRAEELDPRTDIWALGVVFFELVTGELPFRGEYEQAILYAILNEQPEWAPPIDATAGSEWEQVVKRALAKNAEERYQSARELRHDVEVLAPGTLKPTATFPSSAQMERGSIHSDEPSLRSSTDPVRPPIVGRVAERALLKSSFDSAALGTGRMVCIAGDPGIGKTGLIEDFLAGSRRDSRSYFLASGKCSERLAGTEAYLPVIEALENLLRTDSSARTTNLLKRTAPTWYLQVNPVAAAADSSFVDLLGDAKAASQERMKREMYTFLCELTNVRPVVLFLDDLHWADPSTVDLVSYIGHRCGTARLLILGAYRSSDLLLAKHPFLAVKQELQGRGMCREVELGFLGNEDIERYLSLEFPENDFPSEFVRLIESRTEGSPLFMVDVLRDLRGRGAIQQQDGQWSLSQSLSSIRDAMPESIRGMIERKMSRLDPRDRELLVAASVQGHEFDSATIGSSLEINPADVEARLDDVARLHRFVRVVEEGELPDSTLTTKYVFVHGLYQNVFYNTLRQRQRVALSGKVAEALERSYGDQRREVALELAYLFESARRSEPAADYFLLAADNAASVYANDEAVVLCRKAIEQAGKLPDGPRRRRVLEANLKLGHLHLTISDLEAASEDFQEAAQTAAEAGLREEQIDALCGAALAEFNFKRTDKTRELGEQALQLAREASFDYGIASAEATLAMERMCGGDIRGAEDLVARARPPLMSADRRPTPIHAIEAVAHCSFYYGWQGKMAEAAPGIEWAMEKARERGVIYHIIECLFGTGLGMGQVGQISASLASLDKAERLAELNGDRYWRPRIPNTRGWIYREMQDFETSIEVNIEGTQMSHEMRFPEGVASSHIHLAGVYITLGETERAHEHLLKARPLMDDDPWFWWVYEVRYLVEFARYWITEGDLEQAKTKITALMELAKRTVKTKHIALGHKLLGDVAVLEDNPEVAQREYEAALDLVDEHPCPTIEWPILGALAANCRRLHDANRADKLHARARAVTAGLADSVTDSRLRSTFLGSEAVRSLG